jgi:hypothetical protein
MIKMSFFGNRHADQLMARADNRNETARMIGEMARMFNAIIRACAMAPPPS